MHFNYFNFQVYYESKCSLHFVFHLGDEHVATSTIRAADLVTGRSIEGSFDMFYKDKVQGSIQMKVVYIPKEKLSGTLCQEIPDSYFPMRENNRLTLYQDAETLPSPRVLNNTLFVSANTYIIISKMKRCFRGGLGLLN